MRDHEFVGDASPCVAPKGRRYISLQRRYRMEWDAADGTRELAIQNWYDGMLEQVEALRRSQEGVSQKLRIGVMREGAVRMWTAYVHAPPTHGPAVANGKRRVSKVRMGTLTVTTRRDTVDIVAVNYGVSLSTSVLLMGEGDKQDDANMAGGYGEGMAPAVVALSREGAKVTLHTNGTQVTFGFARDPSYPAATDDSLFFSVKHLSGEARDTALAATTLSIRGAPDNAFCEDNYLMLRQSVPGELSCGDSGRLLLETPGKWFHSGILLKSDADTLVGCDVRLPPSEVGLTQMRSDMSVTRSLLARMWDDAIATNGRRAVVLLYDMLRDLKTKADALERRFGDWLDSESGDALLALFHERHGPEALAVDVSDSEGLRYATELHSIKSVKCTEALHRALSTANGFDERHDPAKRAETVFAATLTQADVVPEGDMAVLWDSCLSMLRDTLGINTDVVHLKPNSFKTADVLFFHGVYVVSEQMLNQAHVHEVTKRDCVELESGGCACIFAELASAVLREMWKDASVDAGAANLQYTRNLLSKTAYKNPVKEGAASKEQSVAAEPQQGQAAAAEDKQEQAVVAEDQQEKQEQAAAQANNPKKRSAKEEGPVPSKKRLKHADGTTVAPRRASAKAAAAAMDTKLAPKGSPKPVLALQHTFPDVGPHLRGVVNDTVLFNGVNFAPAISGTSAIDGWGERMRISDCVHLPAVPPDADGILGYRCTDAVNNLATIDHKCGIVPSPGVPLAVVSHTPMTSFYVDSAGNLRAHVGNGVRAERVDYTVYVPMSYASGDFQGVYGNAGTPGAMLTASGFRSYLLPRRPAAAALVAAGVLGVLRAAVPQIPEHLATAEAVCEWTMASHDNAAAVLGGVTAFFRSFKGAGVDVEPFDAAKHGNKYAWICAAKAGACRHRAAAAMVTLLGAGIAARYVRNASHAFLEVHLPPFAKPYTRGWHVVDLGGRPGVKVTTRDTLGVGAAAKAEAEASEKEGTKVVLNKGLRKVEVWCKGEIDLDRLVTALKAWGTSYSVVEDGGDV